MLRPALHTHFGMLWGGLCVPRGESKGGTPLPCPVPKAQRALGRLGPELKFSDRPYDSKGARQWMCWSQHSARAAARRTGGLRGVSGRPREVDVIDGVLID